MKKSGEGVLALSGELTIEIAEELRLELLKSIKKVDILTLDINEAADIDLSCIQLFCSANRTFNAENKRISIKHNCGSDVSNAVIRDAGFGVSQCMSAKYCKNCLWEEAMQDD